MAQRVIPLTCTVPKQTSVAQPVSFPLAFPSAEVERIDVRVPPGFLGLVGFSINNGGGNFIPEGNGNWIIADDQFMQWPLSDAPNNGNWTIQAYNLDYVSHSFYVYFNISNLAVINTPLSSGLVGA